MYFGDAKHQATNTPRRFNRALARFVTVTVFVVARSAKLNPSQPQLSWPRVKRNSTHLRNFSLSTALVLTVRLYSAISLFLTVRSLANQQPQFLKEHYSHLAQSHLHLYQRQPAMQVLPPTFSGNAIAPDLNPQKRNFCSQQA